MKRIVSFLVAFLASAALCGSSAAQQKGGYATRTLTAASIESLSNSLCIELTLVDSSTPRAVVEIPQSIQEKVECRIVGTELRLRCRKGYGNRGSSSNPIRVRIESSGMRLINNMGVLTLKYRNKRLDELEIRNAGVCDWKADRLAIGNLTVSNSGVFDIDVRSIDARTVTMQNSGRYTCDVSTLSCDKWESINSGVSEIRSVVAAQSVSFLSAGRSEATLDVDCGRLALTSTGVGDITLRGSADKVDVVSTGLANISTSELKSQNK